MRAVLTTNRIVFSFCFLLHFSSGGSSQAQQINDENQQIKYCRLSSQHTLCKFQGIDEKCGPVLARGVDEKSKQVILHIHNTLRSLVAFGGEIRGQPGPQPPAANMQLMVWDEELSATAQRHSEQCKFEHDCNECRKVDRFPVGQNLGVEWTTGPPLNSNWKKVVTKWYEDEVHMFPNSSSQSYRFSAFTGHYSQLVWANSNRVGCGYTSFLNGSVSTNLFVCNYGPAGNFLGFPVYKKGSACSQCPLNTACNPKNTFPNLCETTRKKSENTTAGISAPNSINSPLLADGGSSGVRGSLNKPVNRLPPTNSNQTTPTKTVLLPPDAAPARSLLIERNFTCRIGDNQCRAVFRGAAWNFKTESSLISPIFLEASVKAGEHTELQINRNFHRSPNSTILCVSFKFRQEAVSLMSHDNGQLDELLLTNTQISNEWTAPPMLIKIRPENNIPEVVVPVRSNEAGKWVQINMKFSIQPSASFRLYFQQSGPLFDGKMLDPSVSSAISFRVALEKLQLNSGQSC